MSEITDFNYIECEKIDANCINAYLEYTWNPENPTVLCVKSSWGGDCIDLTKLVKAAETITHLEISENCLIFHKEDGSTDCITGDELSRIISLTKLKDIDQTKPATDGSVFIYNETTKMFEPYDLKTTIGNLNILIGNLNAKITQLENRVSVLEEKLTPPEDAPDDVKVMFGNINLYSDPNVQIPEGSGTITSLDKTHGLYTHKLADNAFGDEIFG